MYRQTVHVIVYGVPYSMQFEEILSEMSLIENSSVKEFRLDCVNNLMSYIFLIVCCLSGNRERKELSFY